MNSNGVEYLIVGGHAVAFHGHPRYTGDIDFWVRRSPENARRLAAALDSFGFSKAGLGASDFVKENQVVQLGVPPNRIDLLTSVSGIEFEEAWEARVAADLDGIAVAFVSREDLIRNKRASGRPQDLADVDSLTRARPRQGE